MTPRRLRAIVVPAAVAIAVFAGGWLLLSARRGADPAPSTSAGIARTADALLARSQATVAEDPRNDRALAELADAALTKARETGDPTWYTKADEAARRAVAIDSRNGEALDALGVLALARHRFREALTWAARSRVAAPGSFE